MGTLTIEPSQRLNVPDLHRAVLDAGFEPGWTDLSVAGPVTRAADGAREGALLLRRGLSGQEIWLVPGDGSQTKSAFHEIGELADEGAVMRVRGRAQVQADGSVTLEPREFESVGAPD